MRSLSPGLPSNRAFGHSQSMAARAPACTWATPSTTPSRRLNNRCDIPVIANGDIATPQKAKHVLEYTGADAVMIGRAAQGRPWIFREIEHYLKTGMELPPPQVEEIQRILLGHLDDLYSFYGTFTGVRVARKHISWYTKGLVGSAAFRAHMNTLETVAAQLETVHRFFDELSARCRQLQYSEDDLARSPLL